MISSCHCSDFVVLCLVDLERIFVSSWKCRHILVHNFFVQVIFLDYQRWQPKKVDRVLFDKAIQNQNLETTWSALNYNLDSINTFVDLSCLLLTRPKLEIWDQERVKYRIGGFVCSSLDFVSGDERRILNLLIGVVLDFSLIWYLGCSFGDVLG